MTLSRAILRLAVAAPACLGAACSGGGGGEGFTTSNGRLSLELFDSARSDVSEIHLEIDQLLVKPAAGPALVFDYDPDLSVDLLTLGPTNALSLLDAEELHAGNYSWIDLVVNAELDSIIDSYVVERVTGALVELRVPAGTVRLVEGFTVPRDGETSLLVDWDMHMALTAPLGLIGYVLGPAFNVIDADSFGTLRGSVDPLLIAATPANQCNADSFLGDPEVGNLVYIYSGAGRTPDDIDGAAAGIDPIATALVARDGAGIYRYSTILSPGGYTLAFSCQAGLDEPDLNDAMLFTPPVDIAIVEAVETVVDF